MDILLIAFLGYIVGSVFRTVYDYLWKTMDDPEFTWDHKYTVTMLISIILSIISAMVTFTAVQVPVNGTTYIFMACVAQGFMVNHLVNKPVDYLSKKKA